MFFSELYLNWKIVPIQFSKVHDYLIFLLAATFNFPAISYVSTWSATVNPVSDGAIFFIYFVYKSRELAMVIDLIFD